MRQQSKTQVSFFPMPQPDELLDSVVYRYHHLAGHTHPSYTLKVLFGRSPPVVPKLLSNNIDHLLTKIPLHLFKDRQDILIRHSLLPALNMMFDESLITKAVSNTAGGLIFGTDKIYFSCGALVLQDSLQCCPICIHEEQNSLGFAYWHRSHQMDGVVTCHKHGCDLIRHCPYCGCQVRHPQRMDLPDSHCLGCGKSWLPSYSFPEPVNRLSNLAYDACNSEKLTGTDRVMFSQAAWEISGDNTTAVSEQMLASYGPMYFQVIRKHKEDTRGGWFNDAFASSMGHNIRRRYANLLMTIDTLFGSWADFDRHVAKYRKLAA